MGGGVPGEQAHGQDAADDDGLPVPRPVHVEPVQVPPPVHEAVQVAHQNAYMLRSASWAISCAATTMTTARAIAPAMVATVTMGNLDSGGNTAYVCCMGDCEYDDDGPDDERPSMVIVWMVGSWIVIGLLVWLLIAACG